MVVAPMARPTAQRQRVVVPIASDGTTTGAGGSDAAGDVADGNTGGG
jgi:hypothetical protein